MTLKLTSGHALCLCFVRCWFVDGSRLAPQKRGGHRRVVFHSFYDSKISDAKPTGSQIDLMSVK